MHSPGSTPDDDPAESMSDTYTDDEFGHGNFFNFTESFTPMYLDIVRDWAAFTDEFTRNQQGNSFYVTVAHLTITADNQFTHAAENRGTRDNLPSLLCAVAKTDLSRLGRLASFDITSLGFYIAEFLRKSGLENLAQNIEEESRVLWAAESKKAAAEGAEKLLRLFPEDTDWGTTLSAFTEYIHANGAGQLGMYRSFHWAPSAVPQMPPAQYPQSAPSLSFRPVHTPDPITLAGLSGYEEQRNIVIANTLRFLEGKPANNLLLYGDRGTGKSATVKAICNEYAPRGLRLIEVRKNDLFQLPALLDILGDRSFRFIIFIDDLSFETIDDSFTTFKALLEGDIETRSPNVVIYATTNRRHLVKERLSDRPSAPGSNGGDVRAFDTMQEQFSLADRFGLTVVFTAPSQEEFLKIAEFIAEQRGIIGQEERTLFRENALRWERWFNGRSPRTAVQYVDWVAGGAGFPWE
jgi:predicted AAA+ superfamily ATPase